MNTYDQETVELLLKRIQEKDEALKKAMQYAHCNCEPDDDGIVRYHSNCARSLKPILEKGLSE
jgi:hypothetical protein